MDNALKRRRNARKKRVMRVRKTLCGTQEKPRLSVSKTNLHIYAQLIDDVNGVTIVGFGTRSKEMPKEMRGRSKTAAAFIGKRLAELAKAKQIECAVFDRGRYKFHGVVAELAGEARNAGLQI
ncbi:MAG: ribosomal protein [Chlamydiota bacterium]|jgi:large subunit ribosomal protein L18